MKLMRGAVALLVLAAAATAAQAQSGVTREQALKELAEARRVGDIAIAGCGGGTLRENFPSRYPSSQAAVTTPSAVKPQRPPQVAGTDAATAEPNLKR